jgi:hypothetical protein
MSRDAPVEIASNADLLRVIDEVHRTQRLRPVSRHHEPIAVVSPVRPRRAAKRPSEADLAATRASAGAWQGLVDVAQFKRANRRQKLIASSS